MIMEMKKIFTVSMFALTLVMMIQGCNTIEGMGEDVESAGQEIEETAE